MELSPIYEALKRCSYPSIEPLIYTNYRGINTSNHFHRAPVQDRIANTCHCPFIRYISRPFRNIPGRDCSMIDKFPLFDRLVANINNLLRSLRNNRIIQR